jgi:hypothetical protein
MQQFIVELVICQFDEMVCRDFFVIEYQDGLSWSFKYGFAAVFRLNHAL